MRHPFANVNVESRLGADDPHPRPCVVRQPGPKRAGQHDDAVVSHLEHEHQSVGDTDAQARCRTLATEAARGKRAVAETEARVGCRAWCRPALEEKEPRHIERGQRW
eukprot:6618435-Prymnesium_polylepis.3